MPLTAHAILSAEAVLNQIYRYQEENDCWLAQVTGQHTYCMKLAHSTRINTVSGQRLYVLAAGYVSDEQGNELGGMNGVSGLMGAFVVKEQQGKLVVLYSDAKIPMGTYGSAPDGWKFVQLGANNYWGWQNIIGFHAGAGAPGVQYGVILAPYGKKGIRDLAQGLMVGYDGTGRCSGETGEMDICEKNAAVIEPRIEFDSSQADAKVFPLKITLAGRKDGKKLAKKTWTIPFDSHKWSYTEPTDWLLKGYTTE